MIGANARPIKEEKEMIEQFANVFTMIDSAAFNEVFRPQTKFLVCAIIYNTLHLIFTPLQIDRILDNHLLVLMAAHLLSTQAVSSHFAAGLLDLLLPLLNKLDQANSDDANVLLKLFRLVFGSVHLFSTQNEVRYILCLFLRN